LSAARKPTLEDRYRQHRSGKITVGAAILSEKPLRFSGKPALGIIRLREIELVLKSRYGQFVPESDDDSIFRAVALSGSGQDLRQWWAAKAPWALDRADELLTHLELEASTRRRMLRADAVAALLGVTLEERERLGLKTIGASDVSKAARSRMARQRKRERDRQRQSANRKAGGYKPRSEWLDGSLTKTRPWEADGVSRRTWERRRDAGVSRVGTQERNGDTPASSRKGKAPQTPRPDEAAGGGTKGQGPFGPSMAAQPGRVEGQNPSWGSGQGPDLSSARGASR
jgi:hypothetical protein